MGLEKSNRSSRQFGTCSPFEHAAARLIDHTGFPGHKKCSISLRVSAIARSVMISLPRALQVCRSAVRALSMTSLGNADEFAVFSPLLVVPLRRGHPLDCQHPPSCRARAIAKTP